MLFRSARPLDPNAGPEARPPIAPAPSPTEVALLRIDVSEMRDHPSQPPSRLTLPAGIDRVQIQLTIPADEYPAYQASLQCVGRPAHWRQAGLHPRNNRFTFLLPAHLFESGDYLLTLRGVTAQGEVDDVSQSPIRVEKR